MKLCCLLTVLVVISSVGTQHATAEEILPFLRKNLAEFFGVLRGSLLGAEGHVADVYHHEHPTHHVVVAHHIDRPPAPAAPAPTTVRTTRAPPRTTVVPYFMVAKKQPQQPQQQQKRFETSARPTVVKINKPTAPVQRQSFKRRAEVPNKARPVPVVPVSLTTPRPTRLDESCGTNCSVQLKSFQTSYALFQYAYSHSTKLTGKSKEVFEQTQSTALKGPLLWSHTIAPEAMQLIKMMLKMRKPNRSLVVGLFTGVGLIGVAEETAKHGLVVGLEYPDKLQYYREIGAEYAGKKGMAPIQIRSQFPIPQTLRDLSTRGPGGFDFILLDDSNQNNYQEDYRMCVKLLRSGGLMVITDTLAEGGVLGTPRPRSAAGNLQRMNREVQRDMRVDATLLPFAGGLTIVVKK